MSLSHPDDPPPSVSVLHSQFPISATVHKKQSHRFKPWFSSQS